MIDRIHTAAVLVLYQCGGEDGAGLDEEGDDGADGNGEVPSKPRHVRNLGVQRPLHHLRNLEDSAVGIQVIHFEPKRTPGNCARIGTGWGNPY